MSSREPCQIRVILVEGRGLKGKEGDSDLPNPAIRVNLIAGPVKKSQRSLIYTDVSSVYFNETKIFEEDIGRDEFDEGRIQIQVEDDQGLFTPRLIGEHSFDLAQVYAASAHEMYNKWCVLLHPEKGGEIQGFLRVCIIALKKGDQPKTHTKTELEDDGSSSGTSVGMVANEGIVELDRKQLILRFYKAEIGTYRQACPDAQVRVLFAGTKPLKSGVVKQNYNPQFNDELLVPIFLPTFADIITIQLINKGDDEAIMAQTTLSLLKIRSEDLEPTWLNMYGPRPAPPSLQQEAQNAKDLIEATLVKVSAGAIPERLVSPEVHCRSELHCIVPRRTARRLHACSPTPPSSRAFAYQVDSAWRARLLVYASIEDTGPREPKLQRMPMILSASMVLHPLPCYTSLPCHTPVTVPSTPHRATSPFACYPLPCCFPLPCHSWTISSPRPSLTCCAATCSKQWAGRCRPPPRSTSSSRGGRPSARARATRPPPARSSSSHR
jgi:hypothetical protein|tara:strand:- start:268 stop:1752 length:1485 start_codon:yes stop_codon:yes gene_type:complete